MTCPREVPHHILCQLLLSCFLVVVVSHASFPFSLGSRVLSNSVGMPPELPCCFRVCLSNHDKFILHEIAIQDDVAFLLAVASLALPCCTLDLVLPLPLFAQTPFLKVGPKSSCGLPLPSMRWARGPNHFFL